MPTPDRSPSTKTLRERAEAMLRASRADIASMTAEDVQALVHELQVHQMELEIQNEELRHAQVELSESHDRYSDLYEFAPVGYVTLDPTGKILEANLKATTLLGIERQKLIHRQLSEFITRDAQNAWYLHRQAVFSGDEQETCELTVHKSDGSTLVMRLESIPFGSPPDRRCRTALIDNSVRKHAEDALQLLNENLEHRVFEQTREVRLLAEALSHLAEGVVISDGELQWPGPRILFVNQAMTQITGYSAEELIGQSPRILQGRQTDRATLKRLKEERSADHPFLGEVINYRKDGTPYDAELLISPLFDSSGRRTNFVSIHRDITERKRAETIRRRLSRVFLDSADAIFITDPQGRIIDANPAADRLYGWSRDELIGQSINLLVPPEEQQQRVDMMARCLRGEQIRSLKGLRITKSGQRLPVLQTLSGLTDETDRPIGIVTLAKDISDLKQTEDSLRYSLEFTDNLINTAQFIVLVLDLTGHILRFNPYLEKLTGWRLEEVRGRHWIVTFVPERERERIQHLFEQAIEGNRVRGNINPIVKKDGREIEIEWFDAELTDSEGSKIGLLCTGQDITDRLQTERALRENSERLRSIQNTAGDAIIVIDQRGHIDSVNLATEKLFGYSAAEMIGQNVKMLMPSPYREEHDDYLSRYLETGQARIVGTGREVSGRRKDGSIFPVDLVVSQVDHLGLFTGILRDISERKLLQKHVLEIATEEQRRIGQELHDSIQQELTALTLIAGVIVELLNQAPTENTGDKSVWMFDDPSFKRLCNTCMKLSQRLSETNLRVRQLAHGIMPVQIDAEGLTSALEELVASIHGLKGLKCQFTCRSPVTVSDNTAATHLYRIAQEAVNNALRHSQASEIEISLEQQAGQILLEVRDNGVGVDTERALLKGRVGDNQGMGLRIMEYRAGMIGGVLHVDRKVSGGTSVKCVVSGGGG